MQRYLTAGVHQVTASQVAVMRIGTSSRKLKSNYELLIVKESSVIRYLVTKPKSNK